MAPPTWIRKSKLIAYVAQFQVGLQFDKSLPMWRNQFKPDIVIGAYERGGKCTTNFVEPVRHDRLPRAAAGGCPPQHRARGHARDLAR